jgi:hypothetical protein
MTAAKSLSRSVSKRVSKSGSKSASMPRKPQRKSTKPAKAQARAHSEDFSSLARTALARGEPDAVPDKLLQDVLTAAVRIYAAKVERRGGEVKPFEDGAITATETVVAACAMIRAADLNLFDVAMWFHRPAPLETRESP